MRFGPAIATILSVLILAGALASAQQTTRPADVQNGSDCEAKVVKHLLAATDKTQRVDQDWNLKTAEAYERLASRGFTEC